MEFVEMREEQTDSGCMQEAACELQFEARSDELALLGAWCHRTVLRCCVSRVQALTQARPLGLLR
jgi:hypothetical protein